MFFLSDIMVFMILEFIQLQNVDCQLSPSVVMTVNPSQGRISVGDQAVVRCSLTDTSASLLWYRRQGSIRYKIGSKNILTMTDDSTVLQHYSLAQFQPKDNASGYILTLNDARLEDSGTFECGTSSNFSIGAVASQSIIICSNPSSESCECMSRAGWASPDCFTVNDSIVDEAKDKWNSVVGLIIALVVAVAYAVIMGLIGRRHCINDLCSEMSSEHQITVRSQSGVKVLKQEAYSDSDRIQLDPSDSSSDTTTTATTQSSTTGPSSSSTLDGQIPSQSFLLDSHRFLVKEQRADRDHLNRRQMIHSKAETSFNLPQATFDNQGYIDDGKHEEQTAGNKKRNTSHLPVIQNQARTENCHQMLPLAGVKVVGSIPEDSKEGGYFEYDLGPSCNSVSGYVNTQGERGQRKGIGAYTSHSMTSLHASNLTLDTAVGTEI